MLWLLRLMKNALNCYGITLCLVRHARIWNEKHIILDSNLLVGYLTQKNLSRVEFFSKI